MRARSYGAGVGVGDAEHTPGIEFTTGIEQSVEHPANSAARIKPIAIFLYIEPPIGTNWNVSRNSLSNRLPRSPRTSERSLPLPLRGKTQARPSASR